MSKYASSPPAGCNRCHERETQQVRKQRSISYKQKGKQKQRQTTRKRRKTEFKRPRSNKPVHCMEAEDKAGCMRNYREKLRREKMRNKNKKAVQDKMADMQFTMNVAEMNLDDALASFEAICAELGIDDETGEIKEGSQDDLEDYGEEDGGTHLAEEHLAYKRNQKLRRTLSQGKRKRNRQRNRTRSRNKSNVLSEFKGKPNAQGKSTKRRKQQKRWRQKNKNKIKRRACVETVAQRWLEKK